MDFSLTDEQELIRQAVAKTCSGFTDEYWAEEDAKHEFPWDFYNAMSEAGWIGVAIPEAYGGIGLGLGELALVSELAPSGEELSARLHGVDGGSGG